MKYSAHGLPPGLTIDPVTGAIRGKPLWPGKYAITVIATCDDDETADPKAALDAAFPDE